MKKTIKHLAAVAVILVIIAVTSACSADSGQNWRNMKAELFHGVPVPEKAEVIEGQSLGVPEGAWGAAYTSLLSMEEAEKWYDRELKKTGLKYNKTPEKPKTEGYVIFNIQEKDEQKQVVVNGDNRGGSSIQVSGGWAE